MTFADRLAVLGAAMVGCALLAEGCKKPVPHYNIGERGPGTGWIFYDKGHYSQGWRYLEAGPVDLGETEWGCVGIPVPGAQGTAVGTGMANTRAIGRACNETASAARLARQYRGGGKADWFLPSRDTLAAMYANLHQDGLGGFEDIYYWSSSEDGPVVAWYQSFGTGDQSYNDKDYVYGLVRPVRAF